MFATASNASLYSIVLDISWLIPIWRFSLELSSLALVSCNLLKKFSEVVNPTAVSNPVNTYLLPSWVLIYLPRLSNILTAVSKSICSFSINKLKTD